MTERKGKRIMRETKCLRVSPRRWTVMGLMTALVLTGTGCDNLLEVSLPGVVAADQLDDPAMADVMVNAAVGEFECMLPVYIYSTGVIAHEYQVSGIIGVWQNWGARREILRNDQGECITSRTDTGMGIWVPLQRARVLAEDGLERLTGFADAEVPDRTQKLATLAAYSGYSHALLGEGMCEATLDGGPLVTREQLWQIAEDRFSLAIQYAQAASDNSLLNMARVGRARVRMNLGSTAGALEDAREVPEGFVRNAGFSTVTPRRENPIYNSSHNVFHLSVHPSYIGLEVEGVPDNRVPVQDQGRMGVDNFTHQYSQLKYPERDSPIPIASWREAQLIIAEVAGGAEAVQAINRLRSAAGLPHFSSIDEAEIRAQVIEERRRELFSEGHRLNDMLRFGLPFPEGVNHKGATYGGVTCIPIPDQERQSNPNLH